MPLFEVAILEKPTKKEIEEGSKQEKLLFFRRVTAPNDRSASINAVRSKEAIDALEKIADDRMEVIVRPFA